MRQRPSYTRLLKPIPSTGQEEARMDALHDVAKHLTTHARFRASPLIIKGGTGLALGYGLPRPSTDLDVTCGGKADKDEVLKAAVEALSRVQGRTFLRTDIKQRGRGFLRLHWEDDGEGVPRRIETKIDVNTEDPAVASHNVVLCNGFRTFTIEAIAESKLNTLVGERPRERARDLYDAAWLIEEHLDSIAPEHRLALWRLVTGSILEDSDEWTALFRGDDIMSRSSLDEVWDSLDANLNCDPIVLHHEDPDGRLSLESREGEQVLVFNGSLYDGQVVGAFREAGAASRWLKRVDPHQSLPTLEGAAYRDDSGSGSPGGP